MDRIWFVVTKFRILFVVTVFTALSSDLSLVTDFRLLPFHSVNQFDKFVVILRQCPKWSHGDLQGQSVTEKVSDQIET